LQNLYERTDDKYFKEIIESIIRIESETKSKEKFNLWDYAMKDTLNNVLGCIFYDNGYKVATNGFILAVLKEEYDSTLDGRLMKKDGTFYTDGKYPNWTRVIQSINGDTIRIDFSKIMEFERDYKVKKKLNKNLEGIIKISTHYFRLDLIIKSVKFMEYVGTDEFIINPSGVACAVKGDNRLVVMPLTVNFSIDDNCVLYEL
jgi:hypothetical protein